MFAEGIDLVPRKRLAGAGGRDREQSQEPRAGRPRAHVEGLGLFGVVGGKGWKGD